MPTAEPDASAFEDYLAGRLKEGGVLQPLEIDGIGHAGSDAAHPR